MTDVEVHQSTLDASLQKEVQELKLKIGEFCETVSESIWGVIFFSKMIKLILRKVSSLIDCVITARYQVK